MKYTKYFLLSLGFMTALFYLGELFSTSHKAVENYILSNEELEAKVGHIESVEVRKSTYVQESTGYDGKVSPAYNVFLCVIYGASTKAKVTVKEDNIEKTTARGSFSVEEIVIY